MKTSVDISDPLFQEAKDAAHADGTTLRAMIERGLRLVLEQRRQQRPPELEDLRFGGDGLQPEYRDGQWAKIRDAAYEGRGG